MILLAHMYTCFEPPSKHPTSTHDSCRSAACSSRKRSPQRPRQKTKTAMTAPQEAMKGNKNCHDSPGLLDKNDKKASRSEPGNDGRAGWLQALRSSNARSHGARLQFKSKGVAPCCTSWNRAGWLQALRSSNAYWCLRLCALLDAHLFPGRLRLMLARETDADHSFHRVVHVDVGRQGCSGCS